MRVFIPTINIEAIKRLIEPIRCRPFYLLVIENRDGCYLTENLSILDDCIKKGKHVSYNVIKVNHVEMIDITNGVRYEL